MMARGMIMSAFVLVGVLNVIAEATSNADAITLTKPLLMPLLLAWLTTLVRRWWPVPRTPRRSPPRSRSPSAVRRTRRGTGPLGTPGALVSTVSSLLLAMMPSTAANRARPVRR